MAGFTMQASLTCFILTSGILLLLVLTTEAITCPAVFQNLSPCVPYALRGGTIPPPCCAGVRNINAMARLTPDRRIACGCIKALAARLPGINYGVVAGIPGKCGVSLPFVIAPNTNCNSIS